MSCLAVTHAHHPCVMPLYPPQRCSLTLPPPHSHSSPSPPTHVSDVRLSNTPAGSDVSCWLLDKERLLRDRQGNQSAPVPVSYTILVLSCTPFTLYRSSLDIPPPTQVSTPPPPALLLHTPTYPSLITIPYLSFPHHHPLPSILSYTIHLLNPSIPPQPCALPSTPYACTSTPHIHCRLDSTHTPPTSLHPLATLPHP